MDPREWLFDRRVMRRNLEKNAINMKALDEFLGELPDLEGESVKLDTTSRLDPSRPNKDV
ncbi:MAG TPA: hypothetical protein VM285_06110 [Polyangia bacterium]|nr:hypothetical protein [Polyangia bacterium]